MTWSGRPRAAARLALIAAPLLAMWGAEPASAEPTFLSKQYPRCTACHYSESGGGLLTPYGRSLSREEISTFGRQGPGLDPQAPAGEEGAFFGLVGNDSPLQLGIDFRPSHVRVKTAGRPQRNRTFPMVLDLQVAWRRDRWTAYGTVGAQPRSAGGGMVSYEHWVAYRATDGVSVRGGRFLPAYGVRFADHTSFTRERLDLAQDDQIYGVEVDVSTDRTLFQVSAGPGRAESLLAATREGAWTSTGRFQFDLGTRTVLVGSAIHRGAAGTAPSRTGGGLSFGYAPAARLTTWTHADVQHQQLRTSSRSYIVANQTSVEALRGLWLRVSPQVRWTDADPRGEIRRMVYGLDFYPRTHWHVNVSYYRDHLPFNGQSEQTLLAQLHLYL